MKTEPVFMTRAQVRAYDARAIEIGIPGSVLMENAARGATEFLVNLGVHHRVSIVCGKGNNGGDGFVMARHLRAMGKAVAVELASDPSDLRGDALIAFRPLSALRIPIHPIDLDQPSAFLARLRQSEWVVDALLGTGTEGKIRSPWDTIINAMNDSNRPIFAIDLPSGLDADSGMALGPVVRAKATATFVAKKIGFANKAALPYLGEVRVISLGVGELPSQ